MIKKIGLSQFFLLVIFLLCINNLFMVYDISSRMDFLRIPLQLVLLAYLFFGLSYRKYTKSSICSSLSILNIVILNIVYYLIQIVGSDSTNILNDISNSTYSFICFMLFLGLPLTKTSISIKYILPLFLGFSFLYINSRISPPGTASPLNSYNAQYVNSIYYVVCFMLFGLLTEKSMLFIILSLFCVFMSGKQGAFLAVVLGFACYHLSRKHLEGRIISFKSATLVVCTLVFVIIAYNYISTSFGFDILEGFDTISEDGGNGRADIYNVVLAKLNQSNSLNIMFGHGGLNSVSRDIGISAHNDFLEIFYDFGIIGLFLYVLFVFNLLIIGIKAFRKKNSLAPAYLFSLVIFIVMSSVSHIAFILKYSMILYSFMGYCINYFSKFENNENSYYCSK